MRQWTEQQKRVIENRSRKIICAAAAGSGKTAVMIERAVRMLQEGADPESFLIITFTRAAASEMKEKIRERLRENQKDQRLRAALRKIDMMEISTIHSFCQHLIRQEFQAAGTDPFFTVCDQGRSMQLFIQSFRKACGELQKTEDQDYVLWKKSFGLKDTQEIVTNVYHFMMSLPDPFDWLDRSCDGVPVRIDDHHPWFRTASEIVREKIHRANMILNLQFRMFGEDDRIEEYREIWKADSELFHVKQLWADGKDLSAEQALVGFRRVPVVKNLDSLQSDWKERYGKHREELKRINEQINEILLLDGEKVFREFSNMKSSLAGLRKIVRLTAGNFEKKKASLRLLDFSDLEHMALRILRTEPVGSAVRGRYREIFVDECQDVSRVQDQIIQALYSEEGHLFMVGDVKQSIYRFRLADPGLFLQKMKAWRESQNGEECLELQTNFRSRPEILQTVNTVFGDVMTEAQAELDYTDREALLPGLKANGSCPVFADLVHLDDNTPKWTAVADYLAARMRELKEEGFQYRDIVLLLPRVSGVGENLKKLLEKRNIPVFYDGGTDFYELDEVRAFLCLLKWIERPVEDETLLCVLRNAPFFFSEEELAAVRMHAPGRDIPFQDAFRICAEKDTDIGIRCRDVSEKCAKWRELSEVTPMSALVRYVCSNSHHYAMAGASPVGRTAQKNLRILCRQAEAAEKMGIYSLRNFLSYISEQVGGGDQRSASSLADGDDVVRIMTMHKSKGLQFPVVFCLGLEEGVEGRHSGKVLLDADLGICLKYKNPEYRVSRDTAAAFIFSWKKEREERAERIRLLYVAMTRAQQRMFLVAADQEEDRMLWHIPAGEHRVFLAKDYLDWIIPSLLDAEKLSTGYTQSEKPCYIRVYGHSEQQIVEKEATEAGFSEWLVSLLSAPYVDEMWKDLPRKQQVSSMAKKSVTAILRQAEREIYGEQDEEETPEEKRIPDRFSTVLHRTEVSHYPSFMMPAPDRQQGAWRGTVMHRFLSLVDLQRLRKTENLTAVLEEMKTEMLGSGILTGDEAEAIRTEDAACFFGSPLGRRMLDAPVLRREWGFNLYVPERGMIVQGVIDCAFQEENGWVLLDYKTDRVEDEQVFVETYRPQLAWYARAVEELTGDPVSETWLYALSKGKEFSTGGKGLILKGQFCPDTENR